MKFLHRAGPAMLISLGLALLTLVAYFPACSGDFDFVNFDDGDYVTENKHVQAGLTGDSVVWAWTTFEHSNWHPLTWLSLELDTELFGRSAAGYHRVNVALHVANVVLLFLTLYRMTGSLWPSALVAALFGAHPLHVESVAWITERKDVLSTLFWVLTMLTYAHYAARPTIPRLLVVIVMFAIGLTAKQMLVTLPCVLILLDFWPLRRLRRWATEESARRFPPVSLRRLIWEKVPMFLLAWFASEMTVAAQRKVALENNPFERRISHAIDSYADYLLKTVWPVDLLPFYPYPEAASPWWQTALAAILLVGITVLTIWQFRRPYLLVGWLWFVGTMIPLIGLIQVGNHAIADRYTYVSHIGLFIALAWGLADLADNRSRRIAIGIVALIMVGICTILTRQHVRIWQNGETLWSHCIRVNEGVPIYHQNLGQYCVSQRRLAEAEQHYRRAVELKPEAAEARFHLSSLLRLLGRNEEAQQELQKALELRFKGDLPAPADPS